MTVTNFGRALCRLSGCGRNQLVSNRRRWAPCGLCVLRGHAGDARVRRRSCATVDVACRATSGALVRSLPDRHCRATLTTLHRTDLRLTEQCPVRRSIVRNYHMTAITCGDPEPQNQQLPLSQWDNEGGAGRCGTQESTAGLAPSSIPDLTNTELVQLRVRVIALENLVTAFCPARRPTSMTSPDQWQRKSPRVQA